MIQDRVLSRTATISVIGLGYIGLHVAIACARAGFKTIGIDIDKKKVNDMIHHMSHVPGVCDSDVAHHNLSVIDDYNSVKYADATFICVPTPLTRNREPDLSHLISATRGVSESLHREQLVAVESTSYPGTTREIVLPILETSGLAVGHDFYLAVSPERIDPGNPIYTLWNTPKLVGGMTPGCTSIAHLVYSQICNRVIPVSTPEVAEMAKVLENAFRNVNIAFINEVAMLCDQMKIDVKSAIDAAATKPFGFMPFYPGAGVGGHCIPIDPLYLLWKARSCGFNLRLLELSDEINSSMPQYVVSKVTNRLNERRRPVKDARILILGITYKRDIEDVRESPAFKIIDLLQGMGAKVQYHDPYIPEIKINNETLLSISLSEDLLRDSDCVVIATDHSYYEYEWLVNNSTLLVDVRMFGQGGPSYG